MQDNIVKRIYFSNISIIINYLDFCNFFHIVQFHLMFFLRRFQKRLISLIENIYLHY